MNKPKYPPNIIIEDEEMAQIEKDLAPENNRVRINSEMFKHYFLPLFAKAVEDDRPVIKEWVAMVGSPTMEAEVVGPNGEVVVIPPVFDTGLVDDIVKKRDDESLSEVVATAVEETKVFPEKAGAKLERTLSGMTDLTVESPVSKRWVEVMKTFGIIEDTDDGAEGHEQDEEDLFDFD